jgi:hypothetical protein
MWAWLKCQPTIKAAAPAMIATPTAHLALFQYITRSLSMTG